MLVVLRNGEVWALGLEIEMAQEIIHGLRRRAAMGLLSARPPRE